MRARLVGAVSVLALFLFGFPGGASADPIRPGHAVPGLNLTPISDSSGRGHVESLRDDQGWVRMSDDLDRLYLQMVGNRNRQKAKEFHGEQGDRDKRNTGTAPGQSPVPAPVGAGGNVPAPENPTVGAPVTLPTPAVEPTLSLLDPAAAGDAGLSATAQISASAQSIPTPEPASLVLLGSGLASLGVFGIRRRKPAVKREL